MAALTNKDKMERLTKAYEDGKITKDQYLRNVAKFRTEEVATQTIPEETKQGAGEPAAEPPAVTIPPGKEKNVKVAEYVDRLISLGLKPSFKRDMLITHYLEFDESHMQREIDFNGIHTDIMKYYVEKEDVSDTAKPGPSQSLVNEIQAMTEPVETAPRGKIIHSEDIETDVPGYIISECKSCGKETRGRNHCPSCGADQIHRITEKQLVAVASVLLLLGVIFLGAAGAYSETEISVIGELGETDNFRQIRVVGKVADLIDFYPEKYEDTGTIRLLVNDGTGDIWVKIVPAVSEKYIRDSYIPGFGDMVDCEGSLFVGDDGYLQIKIRDKNLFRIMERVYTEITIDDLVPADIMAFEVGTQVTVSGQIQGNFYIDGFAYILDLADDNGKTVSIFIPDVIGQLTGELDLDEIYLARVRVSGALEWYESAQEWEIIPASTAGIEVVSGYEADTYITLTLDQLLNDAENYSGNYVEIHNASVTWIYGNGDWLFSISDSSTNNEISVIVDNSANASVPFYVSDTVNIRGMVIPYEGEFEIKIRAMSSDYSLRLSEMGGGA
ncbi:MAG: hypothetical protein KKH41_08515 [Candidatus Thermoplasmatota archaeon]|nr:hypothetical protein [Euryarchaeota archaeon]MBU4032504.1 hypothetical protein [Candidatus Thermoplasmatota archaeon]MBU4070917.1 hypothetical protein [Candidatus Thermoplasmatota archaeon]MBU4144302.1 hypothetical protein [Candidatus Thermoplasmatota archaeon]MBU4592607.1 hypothetical protein [Candidatus Thermoplasmatota archaeon]